MDTQSLPHAHLGLVITRMWNSNIGPDSLLGLEHGTGVWSWTGLTKMCLVYRIGQKLVVLIHSDAQLTSLVSRPMLSVTQRTWRAWHLFLRAWHQG